MPYVLHSLENLNNVSDRAADMFIKKIHGFNPPVPTPEVQTSQSSVLLGRGERQEPITEQDSRFPVRPANTTNTDQFVSSLEAPWTCRIE